MWIFHFFQKIPFFFRIYIVICPNDILKKITRGYVFRTTSSEYKNYGIAWNSHIQQEMYIDDDYPTQKKKKLLPAQRYKNMRFCILFHCWRQVRTRLAIFEIPRIILWHSTNVIANECIHIILRRLISMHYVSTQF